MKKVIFLILTTIFTIQLAYGCPADPTPFEYTQPDGTKVTLQVHGDEFGSWIETESNTIVVINDEGYVEYATIEDGAVVGSGIRYGSRARRASSRNSNSTRTANMGIPDRDSLLSQFAIQREILMEALDSMKQAESENEEPIVARKVAGPARAAAEVKPLSKVPDQKVLCILMQFSGKSFSLKKSDFNAMWNNLGHDVEKHVGSVRDFYREDSYGQNDVRADIYGPYTAKYKFSHYKKTTLLAQVSFAKELVKEAINAAIASGVKLSDYDKNGDGIVDCVHVIYAGYGNDDGYSKVGLFRSHKDEVTVKQGEYKTQDYIITPELDGIEGTTISPFGVVCHEYGHVLGAPDFYDHNGVYPGTGFYDLMGLGCKNDEGRCPAHNNPLTRFWLFGWTPAINLVQRLIMPTDVNKKYILKPSHENKDFWVLPTGDDDMFLLECRKKEGYDTHIPGYGGLLVYHSHKDIEKAVKNNTVNNNHPQKFYIVNPCSTYKKPGIISKTYGPSPSILSGVDWAYPGNGHNIFFAPESTPSAISWNGKSAGINVCFIRSVDEGVQFVVNPQITGPNQLSDTAKYEIENVSQYTNVKWNLINTSGINIALTNEVAVMEVRSIVLKRDITSTPVVKRIILQATASAPIRMDIKDQFHYQMLKDITLTDVLKNVPAKSATHSGQKTEIETQNMKEENTSYRLVYANPVTNSAEIRVEKLENGVYVPFEGEYTLSLWGDRAGITHQRAEGLPICTFDCTNIPMGVYQIVLQINGKVAASSKMLKLM